jgi:hypothetical protein
MLPQQGKSNELLAKSMAKILDSNNSAKFCDAVVILRSCSHCEPGTLDRGKVQGKIVLCNHSQGDTSKQVKADELKSAGAVGCIFVNDAELAVATTYLDFPATEVTSASAAAIRKYIASTR